MCVGVGARGKGGRPMLACPIGAGGTGRAGAEPAGALGLGTACPSEKVGALGLGGPLPKKAAALGAEAAGGDGMRPGGGRAPEALASVVKTRRAGSAGLGAPVRVRTLSSRAWLSNGLMR